MTLPARLAAALIASVVWIGLLVQFAALFLANRSVLLSLQTMLVYFTITTNCLVAIVMTCVTLNLSFPRKSFLLAGTALCILLVGVVYHLLLRGLRELSGGSALADTLLHSVAPVLVPLYWYMFLPRGLLRWIDPCLWAIYPLAYLVYALSWGGVTGRYPYPFLNVSQFGVGRVTWNVVVIAIGFLGAGYGLVSFDRSWRPSKSVA